MIDCKEGWELWMNFCIQYRIYVAVTSHDKWTSDSDWRRDSGGELIISISCTEPMGFHIINKRNTFFLNVCLNDSLSETTRTPESYPGFVNDPSLLVSYSLSSKGSIVVLWISKLSSMEAVFVLFHLNNYLAFKNVPHYVSTWALFSELTNVFMICPDTCSPNIIKDHLLPVIYCCILFKRGVANVYGKSASWFVTTVAWSV